jgi:hypothetical protein
LPHKLKPKVYNEPWLTLEKLHDEGKAQAIGVSKYQPEHINEMKEYADIWPPAVNQVLVTRISQRYILCLVYSGVLLTYFLATSLDTATGNSKLLHREEHSAPSFQSSSQRHQTGRADRGIDRGEA